MDNKHLSLVLPCYRPGPGWSDKVLHYYSSIKERLSKTELSLIVVNDGTPGMINAEELQKLKEKIKNFSYFSYEKNKGKGYAVRYGVNKAVTTAVIYTDLDVPYTVDSFCAIAELLMKYDVVVGIKNNAYYSNVPFWRRGISKVLQHMVGFFFPGIMTTDTQCGLKGFKGKAKDIFLTTQVNDYLFDLEFVVNISADRSISSAVKEVQLRDDVSFGQISITTILKELLNFLKIIFIKKRFQRKK